MKRPSARAPKDIKPRKPTTAEVDDEYAERVAEPRRVAIAKLDERILKYLRQHHGSDKTPARRWAYTEDIAVVVGATRAQVKSRCIVLEKRGELESVKKDSPKSGLGRRYYRLKGAADGK